jgi:hypothetical protein
MPSWLSNLPWWVKLPGILAGSLVSAFSNRLPEVLQTFGLFAGLAFALLFAVAWGWHIGDTLRTKRGKPKLKLEPIHVIILGLMIALGGVTWQWRTGLAVDPQVTALQTEVANLRKDLANAVQTKPVFPLKEIPIVKTDPSDVRIKLEAIDSILVLLRADSEEMIDKGMQLATGGWRNALNAHDMKVWDPYRREVAAWKSNYERISNNMTKKQQESDKFPDIYVLLTQTYKDQFDKKMNRFHNAVWNTAENPQGLNYNFFMEPIADDFYSELQILQNWRRETIVRAVTLRKTLSQ